MEDARDISHAEYVITPPHRCLCDPPIGRIDQCDCSFHGLRRAVLGSIWRQYGDVYRGYRLVRARASGLNYYGDLLAQTDQGSGATA